MSKWNINYSNTHILPIDFEYYEPTTLDEAVEILSRLGPEAKIIAGGTDLLVQIKMGVLKPKYIVNIKRIPGLDSIVEYEDHLSIGALARLRTLEKNPIIKEKFPALYEAIRSMASIQIRNLGTVGGNLCNASPAADTAPPLLVYNAKLKIYGPHGHRMIGIEEFFTGPKKTVLKYNEILTEIILPYPPNNTGSTFIKIARTAMDLAKVNVAVKLVISDDDTVDDVAVALGSVAPTPIRAKTVEEYLRGKKFSEELAKQAAKLVVRDIKPITDVRSTAEYRMIVSQIVVYDALLTSYKRVKGG